LKCDKGWPQAAGAGSGLRSSCDTRRVHFPGCSVAHEFPVPTSSSSAGVECFTRPLRGGNTSLRAGPQAPIPPPRIISVRLLFIICFYFPAGNKTEAVDQGIGPTIRTFVDKWTTIPAISYLLESQYSLNKLSPALPWRGATRSLVIFSAAIDGARIAGGWI
jgi:hypothetical protein